MDNNDQEFFKHSDKDAWGRSTNKSVNQVQKTQKKQAYKNPRKISDKGISWVLWLLILGAIGMYFFMQQRGGYNKDIPVESMTSTMAPANEINQIDSSYLKVQSSSNTEGKDFFEDLAKMKKEKTYAYAWIVYVVKNLEHQEAKTLSQGGWEGGEHFDPIVIPAANIPHYDTMAYYTGITEFTFWSDDVKYQFLDDAEARLLKSSMATKIVLDRKVYTFSSYADASGNLENKKKGEEITSGNY